DGARPTGRTAQPRGEQRYGTGLGPSQPTAQAPAGGNEQRIQRWGSQADPPRWTPPTTSSQGGEVARSAQSRGWSPGSSPNGGWSRPVEPVRASSGEGGRSGWTAPPTQYGNYPGVERVQSQPAERASSGDRGGWGQRVERGNSGGWAPTTGSAQPRERGGWSSGSSAPRVERGDGGRMSASPQRSSGQSSGDQGGRGAHRR
ncbi:MAG TPA: hypothetical protein VF832_04800, partial [Longimicrobiales bacterium]